ncbi:hypothetical protein DEU56DRAFT_804787 [Suillus clintonianus]|uniref:uncharacterized protein n=1 Tax=Suillus clintonianus TaxID=1904413 RepID=UPI001B874558|nr:uncharacterized protein DEU56DRAFT_804787 [Suillus clintonianus]KAG2137055.1 hypothetical protein DEU56DRAFT_804787 [Suillus clintonianus]
MAMKSEAFDDSKSFANSPPSYDTISTTGLSTDSIKSKRPFIFSSQSTKQERATVLSRIRDLVSTQTFTTSLSIDETVNDCASTLSAAQFSDLLQTPNIEGHTALYWAIVNHRREAFLALASFISKYSSKCSSDLRLACMQTSNQALFSQLSVKDESLRQFLGCPPDDIEIHEGRGLDDHQFTASFRIRMFQKRLRTTEKLNCEFVGGGMWSMPSYCPSRWYNDAISCRTYMVVEL